MPENAKKKLPRVVLVASEHSVCNFSMFLSRLLVGLAEEAVPVILVLPSKCDPGKIFTAHAEVVSFPVFDLPLMNPVNVRLLTERLKKFEPTVLHCLCDTRASLTRQLARRMDIPYLLTVNSLHSRWRRLSISTAHCAKIITPAGSIAENIAEIYPLFADRVRQINIGTYVSDTSTCFSESSRLPCMVVTQPLANADGFEKLFNVVRHLNIEGYEFTMVAALGDKNDRKLWKLLSVLGLLHIVTVIPKAMPWRAILGAADILVQPQPSRVFDAVLLEAMSLGLAVAGCEGGVADLIIPDKTAVVFDPNDEVSIMRTLKRLLDRREFARQLSRNCRQYIRENHKVSNMICDILLTYHEAHEWPRDE